MPRSMRRTRYAPLGGRLGLTLLVFLTLSVAAAMPTQAKRVICIDNCGTPFVNNKEGFERMRAQAEDDFDLSGNLKDCLAKVKDGDELIIIAHGHQINQGGMLKGTGFTFNGVKYSGFGSAPGEAPVPAGFGSLKNVKVTFCTCWSALPPAPACPGPTLVEKLITAMGGAASGHIGAGFMNQACAAALVDLSGGTAEEQKKAEAALEADGSWESQPPANRPNTPMNQMSAAQAIVDSKVPPAGTVKVMISYLAPMDKEDCTSEGAAGGCGCSDPIGPGCGVGTSFLYPICEIKALHSGPPTRLEVITQDLGVGLCDIQILKQENASVNVPSFSMGTTEQVVVTATKQMQGQPSTVQLQVTDCLGFATLCDPVLTLVVRETGKPARQTVASLPAEESQITVLNGVPGVENLLVTVNGVKFRVNQLGDGDQMILDVSEAMLPGSQNVVILSASGKPGGSATVMIHD